MARVLVVEDEAVMAKAVATGLRRASHVVDVAADGRAALERTRIISYDLVLLDRDLPLVHGDEVCRALVARGDPARILMLTAARAVPDRVNGLHLGADDYLTKPFAFDELLARVDAVLRRPETRAAQLKRVGDIEIDRARRTVTRAGRPVELSVKEFGVLDVLAGRAGELVSAEELLHLVWDENADPFTNAVRVTMVGLRKKLGDPQCISTVRGVGYRLDTDGAAEAGDTR